MTEVQDPSFLRMTDTPLVGRTKYQRIPPYNYGFSVILRAVCHSERQRRILVVVLGDPLFLRMTDTPLWTDEVPAK